MALTETAAVRLKTSDQPKQHREDATGDAVTKDFKLEVDRILLTPAPLVYKDGTLQTVTTDYTVDEDNGWVSFVAAPAINADLKFVYSATVYTDEEVDYFITEASGNLTLASAFMLIAWSTNAAKLAIKRTLAGGGGFGTEVLDTSVMAKELREQAKAYVEQYQTFEGNQVAADGITEVVWTSQIAEDWFVRELLKVQ